MPKPKSKDGFTIYPGNKVWVIVTRRVPTDNGLVDFCYPVSCRATEKFLKENENSILFQFHDLAKEHCNKKNPTFS